MSAPINTFRIQFNPKSADEHLNNHNSQLPPDSVRKRCNFNWSSSCLRLSLHFLRRRFISMHSAMCDTNLCYLSASISLRLGVNSGHSYVCNVLYTCTLLSIYSFFFRSNCVTLLALQPSVGKMEIFARKVYFSIAHTHFIPTRIS